MKSPRAKPWTRSSGRESSAPRKVRSSARHECGLTLRSRRGPTASRQAREAVGHIIRLAGLASCRWSRLTSNVRPRMPPVPYLSNLSGGLYRQSLPVSRLAGAAATRLQSAASRSSPEPIQMRTRGVHASASCVHRAFHRLSQFHHRQARCPHAASRARSNPSVEARPNGIAPCPRSAWGT